VGDELKKAKNLAFRLLKYRDRSERELVNRLRKKKVSKEVIEKVIAELKSLSLLDDRKFAKSWIQERIRRGYGLLKIKAELKEKGIDQDLLKDLLENLNKDEWVLPQIRELAQKRIKKYNKIDLNVKRKVLSYLARRGFPYEKVIRVLKEL